MGALSQIESSGPCFGVVALGKEILTVAGRISTMERGLFATSLDPRTGKPNWRVRLATDPIYANWRTYLGRLGVKEAARWILRTESQDYDCLLGLGLSMWANVRSTWSRTSARRVPTSSARNRSTK